MVQYYLNTLITVLKTTGALSLAINLMFIASIGIIIYALHGLLKNLPYTIFDIFLSQVLLIAPYIITYYIGLGASKNLLLLCGQLLIINIMTLPTLWYLKKYRWSSGETENVNILSWKSPLFYHDLNITLIYIYTFFVYILILRFCSLNINIDVSFIFCMETIPVIMLIICYIPIIYYLLQKLKNIREYLWSRTYNFLYSGHLYLIQKKAYFKIYMNVHKANFALVCFCFLKGIKQGKTQKMLTTITTLFSKKPLIRIMIPIVFGLLEAIITKHLHYFFSILLGYFLIYIICNLSFQIYLTNIALTICESDYIYKNWFNPHFPAQFWYFFDDESGSRLWFNFSWEHTEEELQYFDYQRKQFKAEAIDKLVLGSLYTERLNYKILHNPRISWLAHAASHYKRYNFGVRYMYTGLANKIKLSWQEGLLKAAQNPSTLPKNIHNALPFLTSNVLHQGFLLNANWHSFSILNSEYMRKSFYPVDIYVPSSIINPKGSPFKNFRDWQEHNFLTNFTYIKEQFGIKFSVGTRELALQYPNNKKQAVPDVLLNFRNSNIDCGKHSYMWLDLKNTKTPGCGINTALNEPIQKYIRVVDNFRAYLYYNGDLTPERAAVCEALKATAHNLNEHTRVYVTNAKFLYQGPDK